MNGNETDECKQRFIEAYNEMIYVSASMQPQSVREAARKDFTELCESYRASGISDLTMIAWTQDARKANTDDAA